MQNACAVDGAQSKGMFVRSLTRSKTCRHVCLFYLVKINNFGCSSYSQTLSLPVQIAEIVNTIASVQKGKSRISENFQTKFSEYVRYVPCIPPRDRPPPRSQSLSFSSPFCRTSDFWNKLWMFSFRFISSITITSNTVLWALGNYFTWIN